MTNLFVSGGSEGRTLIRPARILSALLPGLALLLLLMIGLVVLAKGIGESPLIDWDEATYAEVAHEAVVNHSYVDFTFNGQSYLRKPPLLFWTIAASFKAFGESEFSARLPSVVMGVGTLLLMYAMAAAELGLVAGLMAGLVPLGFYFFVARGGRECATDAPLIFFSTLAIFALGRARSHRGWVPVVGLACGFALLSKGAAGLIPLSVAAIAVLAVPAFSKLGTLGLTTIVAASAAVAAPWFVYELIHNGPVFWTIYIKHETLTRIAKHLEDKPAAAGFTARTFIGEIRFLWPLLLPLAGLACVAMRHWGRGMLGRIPASVRVWLLWLVVAFTAACAVQTKLGWYVLPALIPVALLGAATLAGALRQAGPPEPIVVHWRSPHCCCCHLPRRRDWRKLNQTLLCNARAAGPVTKWRCARWRSLPCAAAASCISPALLYQLRCTTVGCAVILCRLRNLNSSWPISAATRSPSATMN